MIVFNGFNLAEENAPKVLRWVPQASFIRWASEGLAVNEFTGLKFTARHRRALPFAFRFQNALESCLYGATALFLALAMVYTALPAGPGLRRSCSVGNPCAGDAFCNFDFGDSFGDSLWAAFHTRVPPQVPSPT